MSEGRVRLIVFDLDGTLIDSRRDLANCANDVVEQLGRPRLADAAIVGMIGDGARVLVQRVLAAAGSDADVDRALELFLDVYGRRLFEHTVCYPGVLETLPTLAGRASLAMLTNKPTGPTERLAAHFGLTPLFSRILGGDGPYARKPAGDALVALMREFDAPPDRTLMVGDSAVDLATARAAGAPCVLVRYGFGFAALPAPVVGARVIERFEDLVSLTA